MNFYPGNIVNQSPFDYRKKLREKDKPAGKSYIQKCVGINNFQALAFARIDESNLDTVAESVKDMFEQFNLINKEQKKKYESILIPYSTKLGPSEKMLKNVIESLEEYDGFK